MLPSKPFQAIRHLILLLLMCSSLTGLAQYNIVVTPSVTNVTAGSSFSVNVRFENISGAIDAGEVHLDFNNTLLSVASVTASAGSPLGNQFIGLESVSAINTAGHLHYGAFTISNFPTTSFNMLDITFNVSPSAPTGIAALTLVGADPHASTAYFAGNPVLNALTSGTVNITSSSCTLPTAVISNSATCGGAAFNLLLQSATGTGPWDLTINGNTYNNVSVGSTIATIAPAEESLFSPATTPLVLVNNDGMGPITVGTRIQSNVAGIVKGLRFYRGVDDGTYTGYLYNNDGSQVLSSIVFTPGGPDGWQQATFSSPVPIAANTNYVVAVTSSNGFYSVSEFFFNSAQTNGSHLTGPQNPGPGPNANGVYNYGTGFPGDTYNSGCYFVDMVFQPTEFTFNLTSVTDESPCTNTGALQSLVVNSPGCSLPVTMMNFSASASGSNAIRLNWATSSEQNNKGFEIRRSVTGQGNWETIGFVNGAGESNTMKNYSYLDQNLPARRYFYQLNQVDFDGRNKLSSVVSANLGSKDVFSLEQNFPNPFKGNETNIRFTIPHRSQVQLIVYDMNGRVIKTLVNGIKDAGTHAIPFQDNSLPTGIYFYKLTADGYSDVKKMTIR